MLASQVCSWLLLLESSDRFPWVTLTLSCFKCCDQRPKEVLHNCPLAVDSDQGSCLGWGAQNQKVESHYADMTSGRWQNTPCVCSPPSSLAVPAAWLGLQPLPKRQKIPKTGTNWTEKEWRTYWKEVLTLCPAKYVLHALPDQKLAVKFCQLVPFLAVFVGFLCETAV